MNYTKIWAAANVLLVYTCKIPTKIYLLFCTNAASLNRIAEAFLVFLFDRKILIKFFSNNMRFHINSSKLN